MLRGLIFLAVTLCAAGLAASDAVGRSLGRRIPQVAAGLPLASGYAQSGAANFILAKGVGAGLFDKVDLSPADERKVERLSRSAYEAEPLNGGALRNLAFLASSDGDAARATRLMRTAAKLSKRDLGTNIWLAGDYARRGDIDASLAMYDQGLRTSAQAQELVIPAMIQRLESPELVEPVTRLLAKRPPWLLAFWASAPRFTQSHASLGRIRLALADRGIVIAPDLDRTLVEALASSGNIAAAAKLVQRLDPQRGQGRDAVRNGGFDRAPDFLPFDFQPQFDASLTADVDDRSGTLRVSVFGGGSGLAARQLVALPAARYRLSAEASEWNPQASGLLYFRLACAEQGKSGETAPIRLDRRRIAVTLAKPLPGCTYHWLTIYASPTANEATSSIGLDRVSLIPA